MQSPPLKSVSLWEATRFWLKLGFISFGGPAGQISIMHQELVEHRRWISEYRFLHALNYCMLLPGPEAQQLATYMGWLMHRTLGGVIAGALFVLPSLVILILLSWIYLTLGHHSIVAGVFFGIKPAVTAIVLHAAYRIGSKTLKTPWLWALACLAFLAIFALHVPFPIIILGAAGIGVVAARMFGAQQFLGPTITTTEPKPDSPPRETTATSAQHTRYNTRQFLQIILVGALLWALPMLALSVIFGWQHDYTQMAWFFTKASLLTFGGAYAVLPYVFQGAVVHYQWLSTHQMMDGLALGESTPGPLIMIVAFVGFVGGYGLNTNGVNQIGTGVFAASLVTWFTFLPSFIFILAGGPIVESSHRNIKLKAPLTAITAAVVGVILNLAIFFGYHVLWPEGFAAPFHWPSLVLCIIALVSLSYFKVGVIKILVASALVGWVIFTFS